MRLWPWERRRDAGRVESKAPGVTVAAAGQVHGHVTCCTEGVYFNYAYIRSAWKKNGVQHVGDGGPDVELWTCPKCHTTKGIDVICPHATGVS